MQHQQEGYIDSSSLKVGFLEDTQQALYVLFHNDVFSTQAQEIENDYWKLYNIKIQCIIKNNQRTYRVYGSHHIDSTDLHDYHSDSFCVLEIQE